jgi:hypothetical protein
VGILRSRRPEKSRPPRPTKNPVTGVGKWTTHICHVRAAWFGLFCIYSTNIYTDICGWLSIHAAGSTYT